MAKDWYVDPALAVLITQWKSRFPRAVVYTIGDKNHRPPSQHVPEEDGSVDAADFMPGNRVEMEDLYSLALNIAASRDRRIQYMIIGGEIVYPTKRNGYAAWRWQPFYGKYHHHLHVSRNDLDETNTDPWHIEPKKEEPMPEYSGPNAEEIATAVLTRDISPGAGKNLLYTTVWDMYQKVTALGTGANLLYTTVWDTYQKVIALGNEVAELRKEVAALKPTNTEPPTP